MYYFSCRNLGENNFPKFPTKGLKNVVDLKSHNNPALVDFPQANAFPKVQNLILSYAYHCCQFMPSTFENLILGKHIVFSLRIFPPPRFYLKPLKLLQTMVMTLLMDSQKKSICLENMDQQILGIIQKSFGLILIQLLKIFGTLWVFGLLLQSCLELEWPLQDLESNACPLQDHSCLAMIYLIGGLLDVQFGLYFF